MRIVTFVLIGIFILAIGYALVSDQGFIVSQEEIGSGNLLSGAPELPIKGKVPELKGIVGWINSEPLTMEELRGKVVLVDFWTYTCINCIRTFPHLKSWYEKYKDDGFVLLGVHTPEFDFEKKKENVLENVQKHNIQYPIALDNDYATWRAFENRFWPAHYLVDAEGNIRFTHFGEGRYAETESAIQQLLLEAGLLSLDNITEVKELPLGVDFQGIGTPEIYLGAARINNIGNPIATVLVNQPHDFERPSTIRSNRFYFVGTWRIMPEFAELVGNEGGIILNYKANKVNVVLDVEDGKEVVVEVKLDGAYLTEANKGVDVVIENGISIVRIKEARLFNLVDTGDDYNVHTIEIRILSPGFQAFAFTFG